MSTDTFVNAFLKGSNSSAWFYERDNGSVKMEFEYRLILKMFPKVETK